jgi:hypothetical protein
MKVGFLDFGRRPHKYEVVSREYFCSSFPDASQTLPLFYIFGFAMDDSANSHGSMSASDKKNLFERSAATIPTDSALNMTQILSRKLLTWGVEERGAYPVYDLEITL